MKAQDYKSLYKRSSQAFVHQTSAFPVPFKTYKSNFKPLNNNVASLHLVLEVCQFARDASVAEAWLIAQEPYVNSKDLGQNVDDVEKLLKRHEAFEKSTATWEERFSALERLTTV